MTNNPIDPVTGDYLWLDFTIPFGPTNGLTTNRITIVMNQGNGEPGTVWDYIASITTQVTPKVYAGGAFDMADGASSGGVVRFNGDGSLDTAFAPGIGTYNPFTLSTDPVYALAVQPDGQILVAGGFSYLDLVSYNGICRLNQDGTVDLSFSPGTGTLNPLTGISDTIYPCSSSRMERSSSAATSPPTTRPAAWAWRACMPTAAWTPASWTRLTTSLPG